MAVADIAPGRVKGWAAHPFGVLWAMGSGRRGRPWFRHRHRLPRPVGAGLGSSAAVEVALGLSVAEPAGGAHPRCARASLLWRGAVAGGGRRPASWTRSRRASSPGPDTRCSSIAGALPRELVPFGVDDATAMSLVIDTTLVHGTGGAGYRSRRQECTQAASGSASVAPRGHAGRGGEPPRRRPPTPGPPRRHRERPGDAHRRLLRGGDLREIGPLASHAYAARRLRGVMCGASTSPLKSRSAQGAWGARMTGAGFGGCAICVGVPGEARRRCRCGAGRLRASAVCGAKRLRRGRQRRAPLRLRSLAQLCASSRR